MKRILVMGLPGSGKTTLSKALARRLNAVHFNADEVRAKINKDLGFSVADRVEQARRMAWLCDQVTKTGTYAIADFVCPTVETRSAFGPAFVVWVDRIKASRFADTNLLFSAPDTVDVRVTGEFSPDYWADLIAQCLRPTFDPKSPTALFVGRWQPFHDGHRALIQEGIRRVGQVCVAVRNTHQVDSNNPFSFEEVKQRINEGLLEFAGRYTVVALPNISHIFYGRDVGYAVERIHLDEKTERISATVIRNQVPLS